MSNNGQFMLDFESITKHNVALGGKTFNKLGQSRTTKLSKPPLELYGKGADMADNKTIQSRTKRKHISQTIAYNLMKKAQKEGEVDLEKSFRNSYHCLNNIYISNGRYYGKYCKNRCCTVCSSIRKAEMINRYLPVIKTWEEPYLVGLSITTCYAKDLDNEMKNMILDLRKVIERLRKRHERKKGPKILGIRSLECTFNPVKRWYHPHFHLIVSNRDVAVALIVEWQRQKTREFCSPAGQFKRKVKFLEKDLIEVIKYGTKIFTEPNPNNKKANVTPYVYISALYNILKSMRGLRLFDRFGFNNPQGTNRSRNDPTLHHEYEELKYHNDIMDWVNEETGETLSGYTPTPELYNLLNHQIDTTLE